MESSLRGCYFREATAANEAHRDAASVELGSDLRPGTVHDDDLVPSGVPRPHEVEGVCRHPTAEFQDDASHVVYSALSFT